MYLKPSMLATFVPESDNNSILIGKYKFVIFFKEVKIEFGPFTYCSNKWTIKN